VRAVGDSRTTAPILPVQVLVLVVPPGLFLLLRSFVVARSVDFTPPCVEPWKLTIAGGIVVAWSVAIGCGRPLGSGGRVSGLYHRAFITSFVGHAIVLSFAALMLDGGLTLYACLLASMLYWMLAGVVVARRPVLPTPGDLKLVAHAFLILAFPVTVIVWTWQYCYWE
jgi:hypothetical protein